MIGTAQPEEGKHHMQEYIDLSLLHSTEITETIVLTGRKLTAVLLPNAERNGLLELVHTHAKLHGPQLN